MIVTNLSTKNLFIYKKNMKDLNPAAFWDERYAENETVYGIEPNLFFKNYIDRAYPDTLLLPGEGEGRNAIYAARKGWEVDAFDFSNVAMQKALALAEKENLSISYLEKRIEKFSADKKYALIASLYIHLEESVRKVFHQKLIDSLEEGGTIILEAFSKKHANFQSGGPRGIIMMYSIDDLLSDFDSLNIILLEEINVILDEGQFHKGEAAIIRLIATR